MRALALVESRDHVCCRYRIRAFAPALRRAGIALAVEPLARDVLGRVRQARSAAGFDAVILQRRLLPGWQLALLRRSARRLVFDFDDAVLYRDSNDPRGPRCPRRARRFRAIARAADRLIAGNGFLADCAKAAGAEASRIQIIPTCVDVNAYAEAPPGTSRRDALTLAWIGSSSTLRGLEARRDLWAELGRRVPGLRLRLICDRPARFHPLPVDFVPWSEATEARDLAAADVGVSWVPDDLWSRGKCGLKLLQYQAAGLPVVANPVGVHPEMIEPGRNGWLGASVEDWAEALRMLRDDPARRAAMGRAARRFVAERYAVSAWSDAFVAAIVGEAARADAGTAVRVAIHRPAEVGDPC
jgi:glycosyltransferase involved in cell wall biosynthesis